MGDLSHFDKKKREVHVLVTGAGSFRENLHNPANMIVSALTSHIMPKAQESQLYSSLEIYLHPTPEPWKVSYSWVRESIPPMLFPPARPSQPVDDNLHQRSMSVPRPNYDVVLFVGMAGGRQYYTLEAQAHRDGYELPDVDDKIPSNTDHWPKLGAPEILTTSFNTELLHADSKANVPDDVDVRISHDAGHYLCDYIFYTGLCEYWLQSGKDPNADRPVVFLHVPGTTDPDSIQRGVIVATELIRAMAHQWSEKHSF